MAYRTAPCRAAPKIDLLSSQVKPKSTRGTNASIQANNAVDQLLNAPSPPSSPPHHSTAQHSTAQATRGTVKRLTLSHTNMLANSADQVT